MIFVNLKQASSIKHNGGVDQPQTFSCGAQGTTWIYWQPKKKKGNVNIRKLKNKMNSQNLNSQTGHPKFEQPKFEQPNWTSKIWTAKIWTANENCTEPRLRECQPVFFFFSELDPVRPVGTNLAMFKKYVDLCGIHMKHPLLAFGGMVSNWSRHAVFFLLWMGYEVKDISLYCIHCIPYNLYYSIPCCVIESTECNTQIL